MKEKRNLKVLLMFAIALAVFSCSRQEENVPLNGGSGVESLVLTSDASNNITSINQLVTFTLIGSDGVDYTSEGVFSVNETQITGNTYTFDTVGAATVSGNLSGTVSNTLNLNVISDDDRSLLLSTSRAMNGQTITFSVVDSNGADVTDSSTIVVNGAAITDTTFSSGAEGDYTAYAEYEDAGVTLQTATQNFSIYVPKQKIVVEDYTGSWCGFCPRVTAAIDALRDTDALISVVAIHETANSNPDPYDFDEIDILKNEFDAFGFPQARINRTIKWESPYVSGDVTSIAGQPTDLAIGINSNITGQTLSVNVDVIYANGAGAGDKLVVYLTESGLVHPQTNYLNEDPTSPYFEKGNPIPDFVHNEVLRQSLTNVLGDAISGSGAYEVYERTLTAQIPADYDVAALEIVVMVVNADNTALNSQHAKVNENKLFE
ncbi:Omp28-related outer membrane protein [Patiriisocius marinus]|uniref:Omp28-related outer membrane protein n=1 Tax=Patiriisocius marinus TaxID=1397112 RepID=UPI00232C8403|nr:Omp28-related outer membrane protein [Patiriisocius marinus]